MSGVMFDSVNVGDRLPEHVCGPISRTVLALYAGASGDHNPMHIDIDFARKFGMPDVFAHGMLSMAYLAQLLTRWVKQEQIVAWNVRFVSITPVLATVVCSGEVIEKDKTLRQVKVAIKASAIDDAEDKSAKTLIGEATIALP
jgi:Acyl dehydratase